MHNSMHSRSFRRQSNGLQTNKWSLIGYSNVRSNCRRINVMSPSKRVKTVTCVTDRQRPCYGTVCVSHSLCSRKTNTTNTNTNYYYNRVPLAAIPQCCKPQQPPTPAHPPVGSSDDELTLHTPTNYKVTRWLRKTTCSTGCRSATLPTQTATFCLCIHIGIFSDAINQIFGSTFNKICHKFQFYIKFNFQHQNWLNYLQHYSWVNEECIICQPF